MVQKTREDQSSWADYRRWDPVHKHLLATRKVYLSGEKAKDRDTDTIKLTNLVLEDTFFSSDLISKRHSKWDNQLWVRKGETEGVK